MAEIDCAWVRERLPDWIHWLLPAKVMLQIETHIVSCTSCAEESAAMARVERLLSAAIANRDHLSETDTDATRALIVRIQEAARIEAARGAAVRLEGHRGSCWRTSALMIGQATGWGGVATVGMLALSRPDIWDEIVARATAVLPAILATSLGVALTLAVIEMQRNAH